MYFRCLLCKTNLIISNLYLSLNRTCLVVFGCEFFNVMINDNFYHYIHEI